ncbi:condensation domain-containing protein [Gordonia bronchialis]|uniref:acyltransferase n=1 Tax=Gordonia bronchialis TaxID=2054 RepID=UPI00226D44E3|nr:acyltransferase [Gordonia bronchialis]
MTLAGVPVFAEQGTIGPVLRTPAPGGRIVEWTLRNPGQTRDAAPAAPQGVSFLQRDHLNAAKAGRAVGATHAGFIGVLAPVTARLDTEAMAGAITDFVRRHEELRAFYPLYGNELQRRVVPASAVDFVPHAVDAPDGPDGGGVIEWVCRQASERARCEELPGVLFMAVESEATESHSSGFTLYYVTDHAHGDAYSLMLACGELIELYYGRISGDAVTLPPAGTFGDHVAAELAAVGSVTPDDERVAVWREALKGRDGRVPGSPLDLGLADGDTAEHAVQLGARLLSADEARRCDARLPGAMSSFPGLLFGALALAERDVTGGDDHFTSTVLATRGPGHERTQGWLCNFAPVAVTTGPAMSIVEAAQAATAQLALARRAAAVPVHAALAVLSEEGVLRELDGSPQMVTFIDIRRVPYGDRPELRSAELFTAAGRTRNANMWLVRYADELRVVSQIPDNTTARSSMTPFLDAVRTHLQEFAACAPDGDR